MATAVRLTDADIGGWLLRCNPGVWDVDAATAAGVSISGWRVQPSYRLGLIWVSQPVVLWVSGPKATGRRGIWFAGHTTDGPTPGVGDEFWVDPDEQTRTSDYIGVQLAPLTSLIGSDELKADPRTRNLEVLRQPQIANPSYLTPAEQRRWPT